MKIGKGDEQTIDMTVTGMDLVASLTLALTIGGQPIATVKEKGKAIIVIKFNSTISKVDMIVPKAGWLKRKFLEFS